MVDSEGKPGWAFSQNGENVQGGFAARYFAKRRPLRGPLATVLCSEATCQPGGKCWTHLARTFQMKMTLHIELAVEDETSIGATMLRNPGRAPDLDGGSARHVEGPWLRSRGGSSCG